MRAPRRRLGRSPRTQSIRNDGQWALVLDRDLYDTAMETTLVILVLLEMMETTTTTTTTMMRGMPGMQETTS